MCRGCDRYMDIHVLQPATPLQQALHALVLTTGVGLASFQASLDIDQCHDVMALGMQLGSPVHAVHHLAMRALGAIVMSWR